MTVEPHLYLSVCPFVWDRGGKSKMIEAAVHSRRENDGTRRCQNAFFLQHTHTHTQRVETLCMCVAKHFSAPTWFRNCYIVCLCICIVSVTLYCASRCLQSPLAIAGPGILISFIVGAISCVFTALAYSEFAARVPVTGSAYSFAYASLGELMAWM